MVGSLEKVRHVEAWEAVLTNASGANRDLM